MLTANLDSGLSRPVRGRLETRLFLSLREGKHFSKETVEGLALAVGELKKQAEDAGAEQISLNATSAVRDSCELAVLSQALLDRTGLIMQVLSGAEEALYSFLGAVHPYGALETLGVIDIGGGSTEIAIGNRSALLHAKSLQMGAARLYAACPVDGAAGLARAEACAKKELDEAPEGCARTPEQWLLVGGTGAALIGLLKGQLMSEYQKEDVPFTREQAGEVLNRLIALRPEERAELPGMTRGRQHILPTGLVILRALMDKLKIDSMAVTARNNCDGFLYALRQTPS